MLQAHHIDMTVYAMMLLRWPKKLLPHAKYAALPDQVREVEMEGFGAHAFGHNLSSLTHFGGGGYAWAADQSVRICAKKYVLDLPDYRLRITTGLEDLIGTEPGSSPTRAVHGKVFEDAVFPSAQVMALYVDGAKPMAVPPAPYPEGSTLANWRFVRAMCAIHWLQDLQVRHHRDGLLLDGHTESEAAAYEEWLALRHVATFERRPLLEGALREEASKPESLPVLLERDLGTFPDWRAWNLAVLGLTCQALAGYADRLGVERRGA